MIEVPAFTPEEVEFLYSEAAVLVKTSHDGQFRKDILVSNIRRRMQKVGITNVREYFSFAKSNKQELEYTKSALTIHTTSWFRESPQLMQFEKILEDQGEELEGRFVTVACAACSTGQEVFTLGLILERLRLDFPGFDYKIYGTDIDPVSVRTARRAVYPESSIDGIPQKYRRSVLLGSGKTEGMMTLSKPIRERCFFKPFDLTQWPPIQEKFDFIFCRNVLIYFEEHKVAQIIPQFISTLAEGGMLCLGQSEAVDAKKFSLARSGNAIYSVPTFKEARSSDDKTPRLLIVDDSKTIRKVMMSMFADSGLDAYAVDGAKAATEFLLKNDVDVISLDLRMPEQDGFSWLKEQRLKGLTTPVVVLSEASKGEMNEVFGVLENGADEFIEKSTLRGSPREVIQKIKAIAGISDERKENIDSAISRVKHRKQNVKPVDLIVIGASTGGTQALPNLLRNMPSDCPPIMCVLHIGSGFLKPFAERLAKVSTLKLARIIDGEPLQRGHLYMPLDDYHLGIYPKKSEDNKLIRVKIDKGPQVYSQRPAVDVLFRNAAQINSSVAAFILTGMGKDGGAAMAELAKKDALTFAQDKESCVVFGMPKEAIRLGGVGFIGDLRGLRDRMNQVIAMSKEKNGVVTDLNPAAEDSTGLKKTGT